MATALNTPLQYDIFRSLSLSHFIRPCKIKLHTIATKIPDLWEFERLAGYFRPAVFPFRSAGVTSLSEKKKKSFENAKGKLQNVSVPVTSLGYTIENQGNGGMLSASKNVRQ
ncbi:MAG: hypothetical protein RSB55_05945 [Oscillospiraceae bacterium]